MIILGVLLVGLGLFFAGSVEILLRLLAQPVLGVILCWTGAQLALGSCDFPKDKRERFITLATAAFSICAGRTGSDAAGIATKTAAPTWRARSPAWALAP